MTHDTYRFRLGEYRCLLVNDGVTETTPAAGICLNAPSDELDAALQTYGVADGLPSVNWNCLLIDTGSQRVLIESGSRGPAFPTRGRLLDGLRAAGVAPETVDVVVHSHGHFDHIGGNLSDDGAPAFPNARHVVARREWEFWEGRPSLEQLPLDEPIRGFMRGAAEQNLLSLGDRVMRIDGEAEIAPGIAAVPAPGHTPGHMGIAVASGGEQLLYVADLAYHPVQVEHTGWYSAFDLDPAQAVESRRRLLDRAAADRALVLFYHFIHPGLGRVTRRGDTFRWEPGR
jgi:glyoxylase-like metal-dependent hydrolase (beta-lactamase superfamily II)